MSAIANKLEALKDSLVQHNSAISALETKLADTRKALEDSKTNLQKKVKELKDSETALQEKVSAVSQSTSEAQNRVTFLDQQLGDRTVQFVIGTLIVAILGFTGLLLGIVLRKRFSENSASLENTLAQMRGRIDDEAIKLDSKLVELLNNQMKLLRIESSTPTQQDEVATSKELDHTLPIKTGVEIYRMRKRLNTMPEDTKSLKPLLKSLERLEEEYNQQGYELVELLGKKYDDMMNVQARFIPSDDLEPNEKVITKIIKPQINYQGAAIQLAEIEVSTGG